jgi:hypothetical protein
MELTEIWGNIIMPALASVGGLGGIIAFLATVIKGKINIDVASKKSAEAVLSGIKNGISVDIQDIVESKLKAATEALDSLKEYNLDTLKIVFENLTAIKDEIAAIGKYLVNSVTTGKKEKDVLTKSLSLIADAQESVADKMAEAIKIEPKSATVTFDKETKKPVNSAVVR